MSNSRRAIEGAEVEFKAGTLAELDSDELSDIITCTDYFPHGNALQFRLYDLLNKGGWFFFDTRNPKHPRAKARTTNSQTWKEQDGKFYLECHRETSCSGIKRSLICGLVRMISIKSSVVGIGLFCE